MLRRQDAEDVHRRARHVRTLSRRRRDPTPFPPTNDGTYFHGGWIASVMTPLAVAAAGRTTTPDRHLRCHGRDAIQYTGAAKRCDLLCHRRNAARRRKETHLTEITATDPDGEHRRSRCKVYRSSSFCAERALRDGKSPVEFAMELHAGAALGERPSGGQLETLSSSGTSEAVQDRSDHSPCAYHRNELR